MAAQEKAKQPAPPPEEDLLGGAFDQPPPAFDTIAQPPPPAFEAVKPPVSQWDPMAPTVAAPPPMAAPPAPSAPAFEDLLGTAEPEASLLSVQPVAPPPPPQEESIDDILGEFGASLSPEEREQLMAEQKRIMASIEKEKQSVATSAATSAADAFESRSLSAAVGATSNRVQLHGQEKTRQAIQDGTATLVQCLSCQGMMQVTQSAVFMFCPVCQTVSPVQDVSNLNEAEALQMQEDMKLAEALQKEEYEKANRRTRRPPPATVGEALARGREPPAEGQSWMEWLGLSAGTPAEQSPSTPAFAQAPRRRGEYDGQEHDFTGGPPAARVAQQQPLFNCVADSITSAATSLTSAMNTLSQDDEGNVHGVDAQGLLSMPENIGRGNDSSTRYQPM